MFLPAKKRGDCHHFIGHHESMFLRLNIQATLTSCNPELHLLSGPYFLVYTVAMLDIALKNLWSHKLRTVLCCIGIMACVFLISTVDGMLGSLKDDISNNLARYMGKITLKQKGASDFSSIIKDEVAGKALKTEGLNTEESTSLISFIVVPPKNPISSADISGMGITPGKEKAWLSGAKAKTGRLYFLKSESNSAILGFDAANDLNAKVGKEIKILKKKVKVVGIIEENSSSQLEDVVVVPLSFAQKVARTKGEVASVLLTANKIEDVENIAKELAKKFPELDVITIKQMKENADSMLEMPNKFLGMISKTVFFVALIIILTVMIIAIKERTKEIGTLRAIGAKRRTILLTISFESLIIGLVGGFLGILITIPASYALDWSGILSVQNLSKVFILSIFAGGLGGLYPAWIATKIDPLEALRYE